MKRDRKLSDRPVPEDALAAANADPNITEIQEHTGQATWDVHANFVAHCIFRATKQGVWRHPDTLYCLGDTPKWIALSEKGYVLAESDV